MHDDFGFNDMEYNSKFYYNKKCRFPDIYNISSNLSAEEKIETLIAQVHELAKTLSDCIMVIDDLQDALNQVAGTTSKEITITRYEIERHTQGFHSMLIIGNKEGKKDESNIH